jgi:large subunit ribosomal protein L10
MATIEKEQTVQKLAGSLNKAQATYVVNYQGCSCADITRLKRQLKPIGASFAVVKNTLARRSIKGTKVEGLNDLLVGPTAVVLANDDIVTPAKTLKEFAKDRENFSIKGGFVDGAAVDTNAINALAELPSKEELFATLLALINAPAARLLQTINAPAGNLARLLKAYEGKIAEGRQ